MNRPALMSLRILAYLLDVIPITIAVAVVFYLFFDFDVALRERLANPNDLRARVRFLDIRNDMRMTTFVAFVLYGMLMECSPIQGTVGKFICRMKVVDSEGGRLSVLLSVYRNLSKLVSYLVVFLGFFWAFFNPARQTWHDKIAGTYVVRR